MYKTLINQVQLIKYCRKTLFASVLCFHLDRGNCQKNAYGHFTSLYANNILKMYNDRILSIVYRKYLSPMWNGSDWLNLMQV